MKLRLGPANSQTKKHQERISNLGVSQDWGVQCFPKSEPKPEPEWTPLSRTREEILAEIKDKPFFIPPKPMQAPLDKRATNKHYEYHETHDHNTEYCISLKYFIEDPIKKRNIN